MSADGSLGGGSFVGGSVVPAEEFGGVLVLGGMVAFAIGNNPDSELAGVA